MKFNFSHHIMRCRDTYLIISILLLLCSSCSGIKKIKPYVLSESSTVKLNNATKDSVSITYSGCGGFLLQNKETAILLDPYFSNSGPLPLVMFREIKSDTTVIDQFFKNQFSASRDNKGIIKGILVAHSHYDHLADIPSVYTRNCHIDSTIIYGSPTTKHILASVDLSDKVEVLESDSTFLARAKTKYNWKFSKNKKVKFLAVPSEHAPHFLGFKAGSSGKYSADLKKFPRRLLGFPEGNSYNFIIDFLDDEGEITFRIFSHAGAACNRDIGIPSAEILKEKEIDVLLLCAANFNTVDNYPEIVIDRLRPKFIIANHWENFFRSYEKNIEDPKTVPGTNISKFIGNVNKKLTELKLNKTTQLKLPVPGRTINFAF